MLPQGKAVTNFAATLPPGDSDLAAQVFKDPYLFDFLGTADPRREREVEQALVDHIQRFLLELGTGFAFVGRQVPFRRLGGRVAQLEPPHTARRFTHHLRPRHGLTTAPRGGSIGRVGLGGLASATAQTRC